jgi:hypothetical protein
MARHRPPWPPRPATRQRVAGQAALAAALVALAITATVRPALAHGPDRTLATNYQTRVLGVEPPVPGLAVRTVDAGQRLELTNTTGREVVVLGYAGEPYLRVGPGGVFENQRSPSGWLGNTGVVASAPAAAGASHSPPAWRRVHDGPMVAWHDRRVHWTGPEDPPQVRAAPRRVHLVVPRWRVGLRDGDRVVAVVGDLRWVPPPWPWPLPAAAALALLSLVAARHRRWPPLLAGLTALLVAADVAHTAGGWAATTGSLHDKLGGSAVSVAAWLAGLAAIWRLVGRDPGRAVLPLLLAALGVAMVSGLGRLSSVTRSQLAVALPDPLARGLLAVSIGLGIGLAVAALLRVRSLPAR